MSQLALSTINPNHIEALSSSKKEPSWLKEYRHKSLSIYQEMPLEVSPLYNKYTDANKMDPEQVSLSLTSDETIPEFLNKRLSELENENCIFQIGSNITRVNLSSDLKSKGLVLSSIDDALNNHNDLIKKAFEASNSKEDKFTALNNAAFNSGIFVYLPKNLMNTQLWCGR